MSSPHPHPEFQPRLVAGAGAGERGAGELDFGALFHAVPSPCVVLDIGLIIQDCNDAYVKAVSRSRTELVGSSLADVLPSQPAGPETVPGAEPVVDTVRRAVRSALDTGRSVVVGLQRYDSDTGRPAAEAESGGGHYWIGTAVPVPNSSGVPRHVLYNVHDVTALVPHLATALSQPLEPAGRQARAAVVAATAVAEQSQLFDLALETQRQLGIAVQEVMLPAEVPLSVRESVQIAVRYQPASDALRVGGDWYDVADLGQGRLAVAVGDVVGHGLRAAAVMGQLRSALSALTVADVGPAAAMTALDRVARHSPDATASTAVKVVIDPALDLAIYSSAGHLPPLILRVDGTIHTMNQALGPPLAVTQKVMSRPLGTAMLRAGDTLVLYTDGLVERRGEPLDLGIGRLSDALVRLRDLDVDSLADRLLSELPPRSSLRDDIALIVLRM
ncbi:SpoIIE family protein phosphatase [Terrabacter sp. 2RAF25]|uniref:SpoIIE family protein phosphatase n=1 Tax=Terrabacter sp. 2RAF25 TaxID=3232998 RepID=UPI003F9A46FB